MKNLWYQLLHELATNGAMAIDVLMDRSFPPAHKKILCPDIEIAVFWNNRFDHKGKTTHEMAAELLALPNIPLVIEGWCDMRGYETTVEITGYCEETAIIWQKFIRKIVY